jgi:acetylornithine deacetylase/succinyl-diaminopimelate desuccinylase-like protein
VRKPSKRELKAWRKLPFDEEAFLRDEVTAQALTGLEDYSVLERTWALPTLEIHGIRGGFVGDGAKTVIPAHAMAKVSLRLVPGQRFEKVSRQLERAVARLAPPWAEVSVTHLTAANWRRSRWTSAFGALDDAFEEVVGAAPCRCAPGADPHRAGSGPAPGDPHRTGLPRRLHSPNEKLDLPSCGPGSVLDGSSAVAERGHPGGGESGGDGKPNRRSGAEQEAVETV